MAPQCSNRPKGEAAHGSRLAPHHLGRLLRGEASGETERQRLLLVAGQPPNRAAQLTDLLTTDTQGLEPQRIRGLIVLREGIDRTGAADVIDDGVARFAGRVRVEIAATASERKAWSPWLPDLISAMVPLTARLQLVWISRHALRTNRLDGTMTLEADPITHLGTDAITGVARLPQAGSRLSSMGPAITTTAR